MARMIEDLLLLTRLDQGRGLEMAEVDLAALVGDAVADARAVDPGRPIEVAVPATPVPVAGDEDRLRQVLGNLFANVRDHTGPDTPVFVSVEAGETVRLEFRDEGPGMSDAIAASAFERFARATPSGSGSGLGLAIVRSIVEAHGGTVSLDGTNGTTVTVDLPPHP